MTDQRVRRLLPHTIGACALATTAALMFPPSAMASPYTAYAPHSAGRGSSLYRVGLARCGELTGVRSFH